MPHQELQAYLSICAHTLAPRVFAHRIHPARRYLARATTGLRGCHHPAIDADLALAAYQKLAEIARTDWQAVRSEQGQFRILLRTGNVVETATRSAGPS